MGRVNRLLERRALRRAADQALLTTLGNATPSQAGGRPDQDFKYNRADPAETAAPYDHSPTTDPVPVVEVGALAPADYGWLDEDLAAVRKCRVPSPACRRLRPRARPARRPRWDDGGEIAAAEQAVTATADDYRWDTPDDVPPPAPAPVRPPLRARPVADGAYVAAGPRLRRDRVCALVPHQAGGRRPRRGGHRRRGVRRLAGVPESRAPRPNSRHRGADQCPARTEQGCAHGGRAPRQPPPAPPPPPPRLRPRRPSRRIPRRNGSTRSRDTARRPRRRSRGSTSPGRR